MDRKITLLIALLLAAIFTTQGCGPTATEVSAPTPVETDRPEPTAVEATPTATPQPEEPTETPDPTAPIDEPEGQVLLEERCTVCHTLDRVERAQKSRESWVDTVDRMIGYGAQLSDSERTMLLDYLVDVYGP